MSQIVAAVIITACEIDNYHFNIVSQSSAISIISPFSAIRLGKKKRPNLGQTSIECSIKSASIRGKRAIDQLTSQPSPAGCRSSQRAPAMGASFPSCLLLIVFDQSAEPFAKRRGVLFADGVSA
jgi:hypothetical protein